MVYENSSTLWLEAFKLRAKDAHAEPRARLRQALSQMREKVAQLVTTIPADCKDLTLHDVSHLDALWEMASLVTGPKYDLNPAEAFVLGAAILLHDAGLSAAAFPGGLDTIKNTDEWKDIAAATLRQNGLAVNADSILSPPAEIFAEIKFSVLRALHASQAETMATEAWELPGAGPVFLMDDMELRQAFGSAVGRIAHSHHWSIEKVADTLVDNLGAGTVLPVEWSVSERKVACILRSADACHIDRRRAPTMLYAALRPTGVSADHWGAQNKINKPTVDKSVLIYTAGQPFKRSDADAWWLSFDLVQLADKEIRASNALLEELHFTPFQIRRVAGAESPRALSKYLRPDGWRPIDAEIKVSDPAHLAATLGGRNLYGRDALAPMRELLQNAADAIRARRQLEDRGAEWGSIKVTIEPAAGEDRACWLHVDDNGIGMTERVMAGPLIDFGKSIWNSTILREEFPGLQSKNINPIGKFGIGFFSTFELGQRIKVISRHYQSGQTDARVLEFKSISSRPIIRPSDPKELPQDYSTRVSVLVKDASRVVGLYGESGGLLEYPHRRARKISFSQATLRLVNMLDVSVVYLDKVSGSSFEHDSSIYETKPADFLDELLPHVGEDDRTLVKDAHASLLRPVVGKDGTRYGRAAVSVLGGGGSYETSTTGAIHVGGFVYQERRPIGIAIVGAIEGSTESASRRSAMSAVPDDVLATWATEQASLIQQEKFRKSHLLEAAENIIEVGGNPGSLPYCFNRGKLVSFDESKAAMQNLTRIDIPLIAEYETRLAVLGHERLNSIFFELPMNEEVFVLRKSIDRLSDDDLTRSITKGSRRDVAVSDLSKDPQTLRRFLNVVTEVWGREPTLKVQAAQIFKPVVLSMPGNRWVLSLLKGS